MNYSTLALLTNTKLRAIHVQYAPDDTKKDYLFKTNDPNIKVDDLVVVQTTTRYGMTVVRVTAVDVNIDFESNVQAKWVVSRVDKAAFDNILKYEEGIIDKVKSATATKKRKDLLNTVLEDIGGVDAIKALPMVEIDS